MSLAMQCKDAPPVGSNWEVEVRYWMRALDREPKIRFARAFVKFANHYSDRLLDEPVGSFRQLRKELWLDDTTH
jgi:hypothetical protein